MKRDARIAGILYILLGVIAPVRLIYIPNAVLVSGNAQATAANIASHEAIFRVAILTDMLAGVLSLLVAMALFASSERSTATSRCSCSSSAEAW
jgi:uncharacterized membrane protein